MAKIITNTDRLLTKLIQLQQDGKYSDYKFARILRVPRSTWQRTRSGDIRIGVKVIRSVLRAFPELSADVLLLLKGDNNGNANH